MVAYERIAIATSVPDMSSACRDEYCPIGTEPATPVPRSLRQDSDESRQTNLSHPRIAHPSEEFIMKHWPQVILGVAAAAFASGCETKQEDVREAQQKVQEEKQEAAQEIGEAKADAQEKIHETRRAGTEAIVEEKQEGQEEVIDAQRDLQETQREAVEDSADNFRDAEREPDRSARGSRPRAAGTVGGGGQAPHRTVERHGR